MFNCGTISSIFFKIKCFGIFHSCSSHRFEFYSSVIYGLYSSYAMRECFYDNKMHTLIIYDDFSKHIVTYRKMCLILWWPLSHEAYLEEFFYLNSCFLEKKTSKWLDQSGAWSMTTLPVIETQDGDISTYIPINVISITDGQNCLETKLFNLEIRLVIKVGLFISRIESTA